MKPTPLLILLILSGILYPSNTCNHLKKLLFGIEIAETEPLGEAHNLERNESNISITSLASMTNLLSPRVIESSQESNYMNCNKICKNVSIEGATISLFFASGSTGIALGVYTLNKNSISGILPLSIGCVCILVVLARIIFTCKYGPNVAIHEEEPIS